MDAEPPNATDEITSSQNALKLALGTFEISLASLNALMDDFDPDDPSHLAVAGKKWIAVRDAGQMLLKARGELLEMQKKHGLQSDPGPNLDEVRHKIGGLLDRLRAARDAGQVSGESDR